LSFLLAEYIAIAEYIDIYLIYELNFFNLKLLICGFRLYIIKI